MTMKIPSVLFKSALIAFYSLTVNAAPSDVIPDNSHSRQQAVDYTRTKNQAVDEDKVQRQQWALSETDWTRYKTLMQGIRGSISPANISPLEVLGTHARTDAERKKYAEQWVRMRHEDVERILAFQAAYDAADARLYPDEQFIDTVKLGLNQNNPVFQSGDRVLVFVKIENCFECDRVIEKIISNKMAKSLQIDIYFTDTRSEKENDKIKAWAIQHHIDRDHLKKKRITLNHDKGTLYKLTQKIISQVPLVFKLKSGKLSKVNL